jgi:hypothetical protein
MSGTQTHDLPDAKQEHYHYATPTGSSSRKSAHMYSYFKMKVMENFT